MDESRLLVGLAAVFSGMAVLFALLGVVYNPFVLVVAAMFGAVSYLLWIHGTGRLASRLYARVQRQAERNAGRDRRRDGRGRRGDFGAGPREDWVPPGSRGRRQRASGPGERRRVGPRERRTRAPPGSDGPTTAEAYRTLGLDPDADQEAIKRAYREKVKSVHPDTEDGDEAQFKRVKAAYERLTDE
ncbi:J domain-containing protein [Halapricum hydrolyticum]|uniref:J domain-containing protein n=1 Tax=Halapricum hydrolyticum TaxID=2979991 RepID=A0AAE3I9L2_9EURY|nr:J domain-containing protein [Halapricum hydrolyticum]MCU4716475.1 J domain-containing protein [Halapricum hydrolyticum]MCU4725921.1 J domain-containing protein [Halapricum hydrolyticum]